MKPKQRMAIPRQYPEELDPMERITNFLEVTKGYDQQIAQLEAERCLQCKNPPCVNGCPINNNIPGFIRRIRQGKFEAAYWEVRKTSTMPSVCSRVCPHEFQCEGACIRGKRGEPVAIGLLERFLTDWMVTEKKDLSLQCALPNGKKVAIIGSGPAGITVAYHLAQKGYHCTIFESLPVFGGMLSVGIPPYRLPRDIIGAELHALKKCGVDIVYGTKIGEDKTLLQLKEDGFNSVFIGVGAHKSRMLNIPGEKGTKGVLHGVDYLRKVLTGQETYIGNKVVVIGGGNVAIDVARTALRTGSEDVFILYRRTINEMPAAPAEVKHLEEEGVHIETLAAPIRILTENHQMTGVECIRMDLGEPDESGRFSPVPKPGSNFIIEAEYIIPAISQTVHHGVHEGVPLKVTGWGSYEVDPITLQTNVEWIFAGGDNVLGPQTVAKAVYQGRVVAESMERYMEDMDLLENRDYLYWSKQW